MAPKHSTVARPPDAQRPPPDPAARRRRSVDRKPDYRTAAPALEHGLERPHQILGLFLDLDLGIADHPEPPLAFHRVTGDQPAHAQPVCRPPRNPHARPAVPRPFAAFGPGAPATYPALAPAGRAFMQPALSGPGGYLALPQLELLQAATLKQCAHGEPFIRDQLACHFDPASLKCW